MMQHVPEELDDGRTGREVRGARDAPRWPPHKVAALTFACVAAGLGALCGGTLLARKLQEQKGSLADRFALVLGGHGGDLQHSGLLPWAAGERNESRPVHKPAGRLRDAGGSGTQVACVGGPLAVCECMMNCTVFGHRREECSELGSAKEAGKMVQAMASEHMTDPSRVCDGMACVVYCARRLGCYHGEVQRDCTRIQRMHEEAGEASCTLQCEA